MTRHIVLLWIACSTLLIPCQAILGEDASSDGLSVLQEFTGDQGVFEQKVRVFDKLHVGLAQAYFNKAKSLGQQGEETEAQKALEEARKNLELVKAAYDLGLSHFDNSAVLHNYYGELIYDYFGQPNEAAHHWKQSTQLDSKFARAHCNFGMYALHNGMYSLGIDSMDTALRLQPNDPNFLYNMAQVYLVHSLQLMQIRKWDRAKIYKEAMTMSEKAAKILPDDYELWRDYGLNFFLGEDFGVKVNWKDAAKVWKTVRAKARNDAEVFNAWLNEARAHKANDDKKKAKQCLDAAQAIWPDSPAAKQLINDFRE